MEDFNVNFRLIFSPICYEKVLRQDVFLVCVGVQSHDLQVPTDGSRLVFSCYSHHLLYDRIEK